MDLKLYKNSLIKKKLKNKTLLLESSYKKISENVKGIFFYLMKYQELKIKKKKNLF